MPTTTMVQTVALRSASLMRGFHAHWRIGGDPEPELAVADDGHHERPLIGRDDVDQVDAFKAAEQHSRRGDGFCAASLGAKPDEEFKENGRDDEDGGRDPRNRYGTHVPIPSFLMRAMICGPCQMPRATTPTRPTPKTTRYATISSLARQRRPLSHRLTALLDCRCGSVRRWSLLVRTANHEGDA